MHKSRLGTVIIDCQTEALDQAAGFWAKANAWARAKWPGSSAGG